MQDTNSILKRADEALARATRVSAGTDEVLRKVEALREKAHVLHSATQTRTVERCHDILTSLQESALKLLQNS